MDLLAFIVVSYICSQKKPYLIHLQNFLPIKNASMNQFSEVNYREFVSLQKFFLF